MIDALKARLGLFTMANIDWIVPLLFVMAPPTFFIIFGLGLFWYAYAGMITETWKRLAEQVEEWRCDGLETHDGGHEGESSDGTDMTRYLNTPPQSPGRDGSNDERKEEE